MKENREVTDTNVEDIEEALEKLSTGKKIKLYELLRTFKREGIENFVTTRKKYVDVILSDYKKLQEEFKAVDSECSRLERKEADMERENEELKATLRDTQNSWFEDTKKIEKLKAQNKELETQYLLQRDLINSNDYIAKKKIKDQLEHYQELQNNYIEKYDEISENIQSMINVLQVLLEESEEN